MPRRLVKYTSGCVCEDDWRVGQQVRGRDPTVEIYYLYFDE